MYNNTVPPYSIGTGTNTITTGPYYYPASGTTYTGGTNPVVYPNVIGGANNTYTFISTFGIPKWVSIKLKDKRMPLFVYVNGKLLTHGVFESGQYTFAKNTLVFNTHKINDFPNNQEGTLILQYKNCIRHYSFTIHSVLSYGNQLNSSPKYTYTLSILSETKLK